MTAPIGSSPSTLYTPPTETEAESLLTVANSQSTIASSLGGDVNAQMAAMLLEHSQSRKEQVRNARSAEEQHLQSMENQQVQTMHRQAEALRDAANAKGLSQIVGGGLGLAGTFAGDTWGPRLQAAGDAVAGVGDLKAGGADARGGHLKADATQFSNKADESKRRLDDLRDEMDDVEDLEDAAINFVRETRDIATETTKAALFQRI